MDYQVLIVVVGNQSVPRVDLSCLSGPWLHPCPSLDRRPANYGQFTLCARPKNRAGLCKEEHCKTSSCRDDAKHATGSEIGLQVVRRGRGPDMLDLHLRYTPLALKPTGELARDLSLVSLLDKRKLINGLCLAALTGLQSTEIPLSDGASPLWQLA